MPKPCRPSAISRCCSGAMKKNRESRCRAEAHHEYRTASIFSSARAHPPRSPFRRKGEEKHRDTEFPQFTPFQRKGVAAKRRGDLEAHAIRQSRSKMELNLERPRDYL